ncbi:MAG TPA: TolC family protein [Opitutaceae bacterium]|nr:TolC family protein [Opitutaceae bacterium]
MRRLPALVAACAILACRGGAAAQSPQGLSLEEARATALRNHPQYAAALLRTLLSKESVKEAQAAYFPAANGFVTAVGANSQNTRILAGGLNNPSIYDRFAEGVAVSQLITDFGRTGSIASGAKFEARAAAEGQEATREQVLLSVEANYYAVLKAQSVIEVARQTLAARGLLSDQVRALAANKLKSELDVSFAQVAYEQAELLLQNAEGDGESAMASLSTALGYREPRTFTLTDRAPGPVGEPVPDVGRLIELTCRQRPDLLRLHYEQEAARSQADAERDANYPTVTAVGVAGNSPSRDYRLPANYAAGGIQLSLPIFAGGSYLAREHEAQIRARVAGEALRDAEDNAARDVRIAWVGVKEAVQRLQTTEQLLKHATKAYALAQARYKAGSSSLVELTDAQLSATSAAIAEANARFDTLIQRALLDFQTGSTR